MISLKSFIASIRPITCPTATSRPTSTYGGAPGEGEVYQIPVSGAFTEGRAGASGADDAAGEFANVIAGQAKTMLKGTVYHFNLSTPQPASAAPAASPGRTTKRP